MVHPVQFRQTSIPEMASRSREVFFEATAIASPPKASHLPGLVAPLAMAAAGHVSVSAAGASPARPRAYKKGFMLRSLNSPTWQKLSVREKFRLLRDAGFAGVEVPSAMDQAEVLAARDAAGLEIPSVISSAHAVKPLSHPSADVRAAGLEGLKQALREAKAYGAKSVLLIPGFVNKGVSYSEAYTRSADEIRKALPLAEALGVAIAFENVLNAFLLSPLEAAAYVDQFKSKAVRWHFDVGNIIPTGWADHWIRTLGSRLAAIHVKEYSRKVGNEKGMVMGFRVELATGDSDWPAVMRALDDVGYSGWLIAEQYHPAEMPDAEWLAHLSRKLDQIIVT